MCGRYVSPQTRKCADALGIDPFTLPKACRPNSPPSMRASTMQAAVHVSPDDAPIEFDERLCCGVDVMGGEVDVLMRRSLLVMLAQQLGESCHIVDGKQL